MDKAREMVKRGASSRLFSPAKRPIKQSGPNGGGYAEEISHRSKKGKARGSLLIAQLNLSSESSEMGGGGPGREEEVRLSPRSHSNSNGYKLHSKLFKNCNGVDRNAAVPRKLRSAMDKRNHEFLSPPLVKKPRLLSKGIEQLQIGFAKKSKRIVKQGVEADPPVKQAILESITKDEEEVVETLFALARMSPTRKTSWSGFDEQTHAGKCSPSLQKKHNLQLPAEALEEESLKFPHSCSTIESINVPSSFEGTAGQVVKVDCLTGPTALDQPSMRLNDKIDLCQGSSTAPADCERSSFTCRCEHTDNPPWANAASSPQLAQHEASGCKQNPDSALVPVIVTLRKPEEQQPIEEGGTCLASVEGLWPSLPPVRTCGGEAHGHSSRSSLTKSPAFLTSAAATRSGSIATGLLEEKVQQVKFDRLNLWKRCAAHVYISQLIKSYQITEKKSRSPMPLNQIKPNEGTKIAVTNGQIGHTESVNMVISMGLASSGVTSGIGTNSFATQKHSNEAPNESMQEKMFQPEQQLFSASVMYTKQKQENCNFFPLLTGGVIGPVAATNDSDNKGGSRSESLSQVHVPYLQSIVQHNPLVSFALPHAQYSSSSQIRLAHYVGGPSNSSQCPGHVDAMPQQHQQIWTTQTQYRPVGVPWTHFPKWKNGTPILLSSSSPSPATEQKIVGCSSSASSARGKMMYNPISGSYDGSAAKFYQEGSSRLQLLCNGERL